MPVLVGTLHYQVVDLMCSGSCVACITKLPRAGAKSIPKLAVVRCKVSKGFGGTHRELLQSGARTSLRDVACFLDGVFELLAQSWG